MAAFLINRRFLVVVCPSQSGYNCSVFDRSARRETKFYINDFYLSLDEVRCLHHIADNPLLVCVKIVCRSLDLPQGPILRLDVASGGGMTASDRVKQMIDKMEGE